MRRVCSRGNGKCKGPGAGGLEKHQGDQCGWKSVQGVEGEGMRSSEKGWGTRERTDLLVVYPGENLGFYQE